MARRIPRDIKDASQLGALMDSEILRLEQMAKQGFIGTRQRADTGESYFFLDDGVLKYFNSTTKEIKSVTVS